MGPLDPELGRVESASRLLTPCSSLEPAPLPPLHHSQGPLTRPDLARPYRGAKQQAPPYRPPPAIGQLLFSMLDRVGIVVASAPIHHPSMGEKEKTAELHGRKVDTSRLA